MRAVLGIVAGIVSGFAAMLTIAYVGGLIFPATVRMDAITAERVAAAFEALPAGAKVTILLSWLGAALAGGAVAKLIVRESWAAWTIGGLFAAYVLVTVLVLPMPGWMQATAVVAPLLGALLANHLIGDRGATASADDPSAG